MDLDSDDILSLPLWWLLSRRDLAWLTDEDPQRLAVWSMKGIGPPPVPKEWVKSGRNKVWYRVIDLVRYPEDEPDKLVDTWLRANVPQAATMEEADKILMTERRKRQRAVKNGEDVKDLKVLVAQPRLYRRWRYQLDNPLWQQHSR